MFEINDVVMYGSNGICRIKGMEKRNLIGKDIEYYILRPLYNDNNTFYVPANNEDALKKMQQVCSKDEVNRLICNIGQEKALWIENEAIRKEEYNNIITSGDRQKILDMIETLHLRRRELAKNKKKLRSIDEGFLALAENLIFDEFAYVLGIGREDVGKYIKEHIS